MLAISFFFENNEIILKLKKSGQSRITGKTQSLELESIDFFVRLMGILGMPRSVGEIYGLLYFSEQPLSMDKITTRLEISI